MIQTAEGALNETHSILQRMRELATQAANDTNTPEDRQEIQKEMNQLTSEINRIGNTTEFNTQKLLNGGGVDPTTTASSNGLELPSSLSGGTGATEQLAKGVIEFVTGDADTDYDGKSFELTIGDRTFTVNTTATSTGAAGVSVSTTGDTITIATTNVSGTTYETGANIATAFEAELDNIIANDENLAGKYDASITGAKVTVGAVALDLNSDGELTGAGTAGQVSFDYGTLDSDEINTTNSVNTGSIGTNATATIDFTGKSVEDLAGTGIVIGDQKIDFFNSTNGEYTGDADFAVDLQGAGNEEAIVDKIVEALNNNGTSLITDSTGESVYVTKSTDNSNALQLTAATAGAAGNNITVENNADVEVTDVDSPDEITGAEITSAKGLEDGEHQITVTNVAANVDLDGGAEAGGVTLSTLSMSISEDSDLTSGTYQLVGTGTDIAKLQRLDSAGDWQDVAGYENIAMDNTENTYGDLTIQYDNTSNAFADSTDSLSFTITENHFEASLTENGESTGTAVSFVENEDGIQLESADGVGELTLDMGTVSGLEIGSSSTIRFETSQASTSENVVGGTFTAKFQIGANNGQSFTMNIGDMRAQALGISGTSAGAEHQSVEGAEFTEVASVTNGTNDEEIQFALDVSTHESASAAIEVLDNAIGAVSSQRAQLGAYQNRLDHTINNLGTSAENLTAAESRIRDVDYALAA